MIVRLTATAVAAMVLASAGAVQAQTLNIDDAVVRVIYRPENRTDFEVRILDEANSTLPALLIERNGADLLIDGGLKGGRRSARLRQCRNSEGGDAPRAPGVGGSVVVSNVGRVNAENAPLLVISGPVNAKIKTSGAVFGTVTRGAHNVDLNVAGCGAWVVANTRDAVDVSVGGSASVWTGSASSLDLKIGGSARVRAAEVGQLDVSIGGSGAITVARIQGDANISIGGSGSVKILGGASETLNARIVGSGTIGHDGTVRDLEARIVGAGTIDVARVTGNANRTIMGAGRIHFGQR